MFAISERVRCAGVTLTFAIFVLRVIGQFEVLLSAPGWLPPFSAWESGLVPYSILLPTQLLLICWMSVITTEQWRGWGFFWVARASTRRRLRLGALVYFLVMLVRLGITAAIPPHTLLLRGLIPILAHWDLAAYLLLLGTRAAPARARNVTQLARA